MKRTILALALVATTFGAFAQTPAATTKPVKAHAKAVAAKTVATKTVATKTEVAKSAPVTAAKAAVKPVAKQK
ncbi:hypothetical protein [Pedobacter gandavensis]|uniref:Acid-shock protein n=1 Tax=Pedobacter gandavensis TaxID=2679963 RepID=A0ABR6F2K5_9SPHI|nr:hypothetical protein [Pedobacter gandavensis]MBB2150913.1 hypothetical protein [Pedobacter gandavensis]